MQYFLRSTDADVAKLLRLFTLLPVSQIQEILRAHEASPKARSAQKTLAGEITELVHGSQYRRSIRLQHSLTTLICVEENLKYAETATSVLFDSTLESLDPEVVYAAFEGDDRLVNITEADLGDLVAKLAAQYGLAKSRGEANRALRSGGLYLNGNKVTEARRPLQGSDLIGGKFAVLGVGKAERKILFLRS